MMAGLGLALGGGGSKGAYQIGAWRAFLEQGVQFSAITGTSIGSINGALMVSSSYDRALEMWQSLDLEQCLDFAPETSLKSNDLLDIRHASVLAREILTRGSLDTKPLRELLGDYIDEDAVRSSSVRFGLMTAQLPDLKPQPLWIEQIPQGKLIDYLMASARLPGLQPVQIEGRRFIDGGFVENVPVSMLRRHGLRRIVAIDLEARPSMHWPPDDNTQMVFIHNKKDLGSMLDLTPEILQRNQQFGYFDTLKALDQLCGEYYTFRLADFEELVRLFGYDLLPGLEQAALAYDLDRSTLFSADEFINQIRAQRHAAHLQYQKRRNELRVDSNLKAIASGQLKVLNLLPPLRLALLLELTAESIQNGNPPKIPLKLFPNLNSAAQALRQIPE